MQEETEAFNKFFITIGKTLADKLGPEKNSTKNTSVNSMFLHKISEKELSVAIKNLKTKYSSDYNGLNNFILNFAIVQLVTIWSTNVLKTAFSRTA